jgi:hypothetical protein
MAAYKLTIQRVSHTQTQETGSVEVGAASVAEIFLSMQKNPDKITVNMQVCTEAQLSGLVCYAKAIDAGKTTSGVETAVGTAWSS